MFGDQRIGTGKNFLLLILPGIVAILAIPLMLSLLMGEPVFRIITVVGTTLVIEYGSGALGIALGISPLTLFLVIASVGLGMIFILFGIFSLLGEKSARVADFLKKTEGKMERHPFIRRWGILALVPGVLILGIYFIVPVAWILRWETRRSAALIFSGYLIGSAVTILGTLGVFHFLFP